MIMLNTGTILSGNIQPEFAYGVIRSSFLPLDAICLAVQGLALGVLFANPLFGAAAGVVMSVTDRLFTPFINAIPGKSHSVMGLPLGIKNIALAAASASTAMALLKVVKIATLAIA